MISIFHVISAFVEFVLKTNKSKEMRIPIDLYKRESNIILNFNFFKKIHNKWAEYII